MKELTEYRAGLLERLLAAVEEFETACSGAADPFTPLEKGGWSVHQLAVHARDVQVNVYGYRARQTVDVDQPEFENFDADEWMAAHYDTHEPLESILNELSASVRDLVAWMHGLPPEAWSRKARHRAYGGGFTTQSWVERGLAHIQEHLKTVQESD